LATQGGTVEISAEGNCVSFLVKLPSTDYVTVLVVDDNLDLVHFYRRYVTGTRYRIVHVAKGQQVFKTLEEFPSDIIVLDVMLPDIDGWELLAHLREHTVTRSIPVVVCSVVRERELALALGAALYLPKPVRRRQFILALDEVLSQASGEAPISSAYNPATC
jgi:DNA-binding response OmpR family regulator